ncbi:hypothetical protein CEUSTIGMA_g8990.t1 [Chlamydomonas eustigma]|uniref:Uncharacterized protein n=1 Tax=Chlamydomonas eustigma TaxID=1157962 RepID=A0A250XF82_9CHLO|nr:hypothetical protein CEUSTIGMA_g8990.t1 [Chlamydomonas eustigma]|eukprot:GAX81562.1 hypothetical protein CEUSTIGMA_g8990.t1 [Chlamydomonas eustigma]
MISTHRLKYLSNNVGSSFVCPRAVCPIALCDVSVRHTSWNQISHIYLRSNAICALPESGEDISDAMRADLERFQRQQPTLDKASVSAPHTSGSSLKETLDKVLIADFFLVLFILAWLTAGVAQSALSGGQSFLLDAWFPLWPMLWQPAIGMLMAGALLSGAAGWLKNMEREKEN